MPRAYHRKVQYSITNISYRHAIEFIEYTNYMYAFNRDGCWWKDQFSVLYLQFNIPEFAWDLVPPCPRIIHIE